VSPRGRSLLVLLAPLPVAVASLVVGPTDLATPREVLAWLLVHLGLGAPGAASPERDALLAAILLDVRLPRVLLAALVGATLSGSGVALQAVFRNPLVCPYVLGLASGAAFGAALALATGWLPVQPAAFVGGLGAVGLAYVLARGRGDVPTVSLILAGVIVGGIFTALLTVVQFLADPFKLQTIVHWTMGNLHAASWSKLGAAAGPAFLGLLALFVLRFRMNVLALGDDEARAVGVRPERERLLILVPATLAASAAVAVSGVIGLVGLAVPHIARMLVGPENRRLLPAAVALGAALLMIVDDASRSLTSFELPIGVFTTFVGAPVFVWLMRRARVGWEL
jgi:iron complex transport system permease protein